MQNYKKLSVLFLFAILLPISAFSKGLREQVVLDGAIKMSIPKDFSLMDDKMKELKYPNRNGPTEVYTNEATTVNIAIKERNEGKKTDLEKTKQAFALLFKNLNPELSIVNINGTDVLRINFVSQAIDTDIHNNMVLVPYADGSGYAYINFNITKEEFPEWQETCEKVIQSIKVLK